MKNLLLFFILSFSIPLLYCQQKKTVMEAEISKYGFYIPRNIEECNQQLDIVLGKQPKDLIRSTEDWRLKSVSGPFILGEWTENDSTRLYKYFQERGITEFEDRNYLILLSYKRHLQKKAFDFEKECLKIISYNDSIEAEREKIYNRNIHAEYIDGVYIPKNLEDAVSQLDQILNDTVKSEIQTATDTDMADYHFGLGTWIRNNWGLWQGSRLQQCFVEQEIWHPDNMSGFILSTYKVHLQKGNTTKHWITSKKEFNELLMKNNEMEPSTFEFNIEDFYTDEYKEFLKTKTINKIYISN